MKIAINFTNDLHPDSYSRKWEEYLKSKGIDVLKVDFKDTDIISKLRNVDGAMWHWFHMPDDRQSAPKILDAIEFGLNIPVFPNFKTRWHYDEKVSQHFLLDAVNTPKIKSWVFWDKQKALEFADTAKYPLVFKLSPGAGSSNVLKVENKTQAYELIKKMFDVGIYPYTLNEFEIKAPKLSLKQKFKRAKRVLFDENIMYESNHWYFQLQKNYVYFQEFLPNNKFDIRISVIGDRAFCFARHNRDNDFRASGSGKIDYDINKIPKDAIKIAFKVSHQNNFQSMAYDFLVDNNKEPLINEISYCYMNKAVYDCPGHYNSRLEWIEGNMWPEEAQVEDFISFINAQNNY